MTPTERRARRALDERKKARKKSERTGIPLEKCLNNNHHSSKRNK